MNGTYPNTKKSTFLTLMLILVMVVLSPINMALNHSIGKSASFFVYYSITMLVGWLLVHALSKKENGEQTYQWQGINLGVLGVLLIVTIGLQTSLSGPLSSLIPMPDIIKDMFLELAGYNDIYSFLAIVIAAPILEELIFRGVILKGMLKNYSPMKAIIWSSILFGVLHLNPWQFVSAMVVGSFSGWVFYRTQNIFYSIFIHFANNGFAFLSMQFYSPEEMMSDDASSLYGGMSNYLYIIFIALIISYFGIKLLNKQIPSIEHEPIPSKESKPS